MAERVPVTTVAELVTLDDDEMVEGYLDGRKGDPEPGDNRSKSYWHGWRSGNADFNGRSTPEGRALAKLLRLAD